MLSFVNCHELNFNKDEKVSATVSIDATKYYEVIIADEKYWHFVGGAHTNHCIPFPEDLPYGANKRKKLE